MIVPFSEWKWERFAPSCPGKGATYVHTTGWVVRHCGHPTANWPYEVIDPGGGSHVRTNGYGFRTVRDALAAADEFVREWCLATIDEAAAELAAQLRRTGQSEVARGA